MTDRGRYDSAMFWLAFGTASAVIGLALMTIGATRSPSETNLLDSAWFDAGLGLLVLGALLLLWALGLFLSRRRPAARGDRNLQTPPDPGSGREQADVEAVRGYYAERSKLIDQYFKDDAKDERSPGG